MYRIFFRMMRMHFQQKQREKGAHNDDGLSGDRPWKLTPAIVFPAPTIIQTYLYNVSRYQIHLLHFHNT